MTAVSKETCIKCSQLITVATKEFLRGPSLFLEIRQLIFLQHPGWAEITVWRTKLGWLILCESATPHTVQITKLWFDLYEWEVSHHSPPNLNVVLSDYKF